MTFDSPADVLNYALRLEHLFHAYYRDGLEALGPGAFAAAGYAANVYDYFAMIRDQEREHVETITALIADLGGEPLAEDTYDFSFANLAGFLEMAGTLENLGTGAYTGAVQYLIDDDAVLTSILTIQGVEARQAAYIDGLTGGSPFPEAFAPPLTPEEVLEIAGAFIVGE